MSTAELFQQLKHPNLWEQAMWKLAETYGAEMILQLLSILDDQNTTYRAAVIEST